MLRFNNDNLTLPKDDEMWGMWMGLIKCSKYVTDGARLENAGWRIVGRHFAKHSTDPLPMRTLSQSDLHTVSGIMHGVSDIPKRERKVVMKRQNSKKSLTCKDTKKELTRPKSTLFHPHPKQSKSSVQLHIKPQPQRQLSELDLYRQPNPRFAFGITDVDDKVEKADSDDLKRSTSVMMGFDLTRKSPSPPPVEKPVASLFNAKPRMNLLNNLGMSTLHDKPKKTFFFEEMSVSPETLSPRSKGHKHGNHRSKSSSHGEHSHSHGEHSGHGGPHSGQPGAHSGHSGPHSGQPGAHSGQRHVSANAAVTHTTGGADPQGSAQKTSPGPKKPVTPSLFGKQPSTTSLFGKPPSTASLFDKPAGSGSALGTRQNSNSSLAHRKNSSAGLGTRQNSTTSLGPKQPSNTSLFAKNPSTTSLFGHNKVSFNQGDESSSWSSTISTDSDSTCSSDEYDEEDGKEIDRQWQKMMFGKKEEKTKAQLKRSLLSGLFLNDMAKEETPKRVNKNKLAIASPEMKPQESKPVVDSSRASGRFSLSTSAKDSLFMAQRKGSGSSLAMWNPTKKQQSKAPPTVEALLPTALQTHMFVPNDVHGKKTFKKRVSMSISVPKVEMVPEGKVLGTAVASSSETEWSDESEFHESESDDEQPPEPAESGPLSPKSTRQGMLSTELSASLRQSLLTDRKLGDLPQGAATSPQHKDMEKTVSSWEGDDFYVRGW